MGLMLHAQLLCLSSTNTRKKACPVDHSSGLGHTVLILAAQTDKEVSTIWPFFLYEDAVETLQLS